MSDSECEKNKLNCPAYSLLEVPLRIEDSVKVFRTKFYDLARSRVRFVSAAECLLFEKDVFGENTRGSSSAVYLVRVNRDEEGNRNISALDIVLNKDFFKTELKDYSDLIPYSIAHEIYEAWLYVKPGFNISNVEKAHLLARRRQFEMAVRDRKAEKLQTFLLRVNPLLVEEIAYAYDKAVRKVRVKV